MQPDVLKFQKMPALEFSLLIFCQVPGSCSYKVALAKKECKMFNDFAFKYKNGGKVFKNFKSVI